MTGLMLWGDTSLNLMMLETLSIFLYLTLVWKNRHNILLMLLSFEMGSLLCLVVMALNSSMTISLSLTFFTFLVCAVCEACVGVSLLISLSRRSTNQNISL